MAWTSAIASPQALATPMSTHTPNSLFAFRGFPLAALLLSASVVLAQSPKGPPASWIDQATGHRVIRLTREPDSVSFYFHDNAYTPDGKEMVYTTPAGISVVNLTTLEARQVVAGPAKAIVVGRKTPTIYYSKPSGKPRTSQFFATNVDTGETREIAELPRRGDIFSVNMDETLAAGVYTEGDGVEYGEEAENRKVDPSSSQNIPQATNKRQMMIDRLNRHLPENFFTMDLRTGAIKVLFHSTDWLDHVQFSPTDPTLIMYAHEGLWQLVDRIWTIRTDGSQNTLRHQRTMEMEQVGHEWWSHDGKTIWYDLGFPRAAFAAGYNVGVVSYVAGLNLETGERTWYHKEISEASLHFNSSPDGTLFCGDGSRAPGAQWIYLFHPERTPDDHTLGTGLIHPGFLRSERLVNMSKQNYLLEPNPSFTPDQKLIVYASNEFGPAYVFAVEVAKAEAAKP
jgi:oligogalacturonide lyase